VFKPEICVLATLICRLIKPGKNPNNEQGIPTVKPEETQPPKAIFITILAFSFVRGEL